MLDYRTHRCGCRRERNRTSLWPWASLTRDL
nr:MAG TPA: hypothetical protein [Caudoviricetes sp.]